MIMDQVQLLEWYVQMGVDETITDTPINHLEKKNPPPSANISSFDHTMPKHTKTPIQPPSEIATLAKKLAEEATSREQLQKAVESFKELGICRTATNPVFCDGNPNADIMLIGEAPGADEDMQGIPFCGASGQMLDQALSYVALLREKNFYITNTVFWRPPGNRKPTPEELEVCEPFVKKHIALIKPKLIMLIGATAVTSILKEKQGITKLRGKFFDYSNDYLDHTIPTVAVFHPSYLLRSPGQKRFFWHDLLVIKQKCELLDITL